MLDPVAEFVHFAASQYVLPLLGVAVTLALAILLHEFGHFVMARLTRVGVEIFSIGFGRRLWGFRRGGTDYRISAVPLGGYVKIKGILSEEAERYLEGEDQKADEEVAGEKQETATETAVAEIPDKKGVGLIRDAMDATAGLRDKPWPIRVVVFSAGCGFNFLVAATALAVIAWVGTEQDAPFASVVGPVKKGTAIYEAGLRRGDRIVQLDGRPVTHWEEVLTTDVPGVFDLLEDLIDAGTTRPIDGVIIRRADGQETTRSLVLPPAKEIVRALKDEDFKPLLAPACIGQVIPFSPAHKVGVKKGDVVLAIDDCPIESFDQLVEIVSGSVNKPLSFRLKRGDEQLSLVVTPRENPTTPTLGSIGVVSGNVERVQFKVGFFRAWAVGFRHAVRLTATVAVGTAGVFARFRYREIKESVAGPLGILGITFQRAREGWEAFLWFMAVLNVALMILNILPIPILDGGHILITTIESVARRPVPARVLAGIYYVFFVLLISLVLMVTWFDLTRFADWFGITKFFQ